MTITSDQDERSKQIEPGAPTPTERIALIERLVKTGYNDVIVGLNPYVPHWWTDISGTVDRLLNVGVNRYWIQPLHLHYKQIAQIPKKNREAHRSEIELARKRWSVMSDAAMELVEAVSSMGGMVYGTGDSPVDYWSRTKEIYGEDKLFPTACDLRAELAGIQAGDPEGRPVLVSLDWMRGWLRARGGAFASLPDSGGLWTSFAAKFRRSVVMYGQHYGDSGGRIARHAAPSTRDEFLEALWHIFDYPTPLRSTEWALAMTAGGTVLLTDGQDCPMMVWTRGGWSDGCFEVAEDASNVIQPPKWRT